MGTGKRSVDHGLARPPLDGGPLWSDVALARADRAPLAFTGALLLVHRRAFQTGLMLELSLWRRRLTGFVIGYPVFAREAGVASDAVRVDSVAEAILYLEDLCAFPQPMDQARPLSLDALMQAHRIAHFHQVFSALVGDALADWATLDATTGTPRIPQQARS